MEHVALDEKGELVSIDNVYLYKANNYLYVGVTTFYEKLIQLYIHHF